MSLNDAIFILLKTILILFFINKLVLRIKAVKKLSVKFELLVNITHHLKKGSDLKLATTKQTIIFF